MTNVKRLTLDRYEHGLLVRALYEKWRRMMAEGKPTEDIEDLILKVIDTPAKSSFGGLEYERNHIPLRGQLSAARSAAAGGTAYRNMGPALEALPSTIS